MVRDSRAAAARTEPQVRAKVVRMEGARGKDEGGQEGGSEELRARTRPWKRGGGRNGENTDLRVKESN